MRPYAEEMSAFVSSLQTEICQALERLDGAARFNSDPWQRAGGGGGTTRVLTEGAVLERAGVNTSHVHGELEEERFAARLPGDGRTFSAMGLSMVLHPKNPMVPTVHANVRFITRGKKSWFGGGVDLTPYYLFPEDVMHFHGVLKAACDRHDVAHYSRFKKSCDEYFYLKHRGETRGVGGLFFDDLGGDLESAFALVTDIGRAILPAYLPIAERRDFFNRCDV